MGTGKILPDREGSGLRWAWRGVRNHLTVVVALGAAGALAASTGCSLERSGLGKRADGGNPSGPRDASAPDAEPVDAPGPFDGGEGDARPHDGGAGTPDADSLDGGRDAAPADSGRRDGGAPDARPPDASPEDASPMIDGGIPRCRFDPDTCSGGFGAACTSHGDCRTGFCCMESGNCRGGMCTIECGDDDDCPDDMACEHDVCFLRCSSDAECATGMSCEHGDTICEWP